MHFKTQASFKTVIVSEKIW